MLIKACGAGMVKMSHVDDAINEMFQATHMQMMRNCCRLEKVLLASILMESRAKGQHSMTAPIFEALLACACQDPCLEGLHEHGLARNNEHCSASRSQAARRTRYCLHIALLLHASSL